MISKAYPLLVFLAFSSIVVASSTSGESYSIIKTGEFGSDGFILKASKPGENGQYELIRMVQEKKIMSHKLTRDNFKRIKKRIQVLLKAPASQDKAHCRNSVEINGPKLEKPKEFCLQREMGNSIDKDISDLFLDLHLLMAD